MTTDIGHFIDGARTLGAGGRKAPSFNPATGEQTGVVWSREQGAKLTPLSPPPGALSRAGPTRLRCAAPAS